METIQQEFVAVIKSQPLIKTFSRNSVNMSVFASYPAVVLKILELHSHEMRGKMDLGWEPHVMEAGISHTLAHSLKAV